MDYQALINKSIKDLRKKLGLTQEQFCEKIGISLQGLSNLERNRYQPTAETIDKISPELYLLLVVGLYNTYLSNGVLHLLLLNMPSL